MRKKKEKSRATYVAGDAKKRRLRMLIKVCVVLLLPTLYFFICLERIVYHGCRTDKPEKANLMVCSSSAAGV